jgi:predicted transcriptional regulator of viral defense system
MVVVELATRQHGAVARRQLLWARVSSASVARMCSSGWLTRVHPGAYLVAGYPPHAHTGWIGADLRGGARAVLSHASAGALWEILGPVPGLHHVTTPGEGADDRESSFTARDNSTATSRSTTESR